MSKFEITLRKNNEFQFNLKVANGEIILTSEGYTTKPNCKNGIDSVKSNSVDDNRYERKESQNGKWYFNLKATNGQVIGTSQMYENKANCEGGVASVKKNAPIATVVDLTL
ncbi:MAG TPA: YegP family protein [Bacteroides reticulotermitis]|nr:YegP family protein [Bacteroides reticulotermitis]